MCCWNQMFGRKKSKFDRFQMIDLMFVLLIGFTLVCTNIDKYTDYLLFCFYANANQRFDYFAISLARNKNENSREFEQKKIERKEKQLKNFVCALCKRRESTDHVQKPQLFDRTHFNTTRNIIGSHFHCGVFTNPIFHLNRSLMSYTHKHNSHAYCLMRKRCSFSYELLVSQAQAICM